MLKAGYEPQKFIERLMYLTGIKPEGLAKLNDDGSRTQKKSPLPLKESGLLIKLGRDLTALALADKIGLVLDEHAHNAMMQMGRVLQQTQSNNPILLGDPGVGKTALIEGFAYRLARDVGIVPATAKMRIVDLLATALLTGISGRGELEERLGKLIKEVRDATGQVVLFIDEVHTFLRNEGIGEILANAFKPALARGEFPLMALRR